MFITCSNCYFFYPEQYDGCPCCIQGVEYIRRARVNCRNCHTLVGETVYIDNYHEWIDKCDYCDPKPNAKDTDIISRFSFVVAANNSATIKHATYTRADIRRHREQSRQFTKYLEECTGRSLHEPDDHLHRVI